MMTKLGRTARVGARTALTAAALLTAALAPARSVEAQQDAPRTDRSECRCVDRDGQEIENCTCLRSFRMSDELAFPGSGRASRARLGVTVSTNQEAREDARGARVESVMPDGPADEAGLREHDLITRVDGKSLFDPLEADVERSFDLDRSIPVQRLLAIAQDLEPGEEVEIEYLRDGTSHTATLDARELDGWGTLRTFGTRWNAEEMADRMRSIRERMRDFRVEMPQDGESPRFRIRSVPDGGSFSFVSWDGDLRLQDMNEGLGGYFGTSEGVLVTEVADDSTLGLRAGDVVLSVAGRAVDDADHLRRILRSYEPNEAIEFRVMREKKEIGVQGRQAH